LLDRGIPRAASPPLASLLLLLAKVVLVGRQRDDGPVTRPPYFLAAAHRCIVRQLCWATVAPSRACEGYGSAFATGTFG